MYWLDEDVFVSYREPGSPHTFGRGETAIVRRHSENVLVLLGDHRRNVEGLSTRELALYYDASPDKHHSSDDTWVEGLSN